MYAMTVDEKRNFHWTEVPDPVPKEGEILLEIHAAALNRADLLQRAGKYPPPPGWPEWMGLEAAGIVLQAPEKSRWKAGDRVCALLGGGGYAEKIAVPEEMVLPLPANLSMIEGASLPETFATAYLNLVLEADLQAGETVFIQAGASGLGIASIQTAKALGASVITTVGSPEKAEAVRALGADLAVNRKTEDLGKILDTHPVDVALDCVGGSGLGEHLEKLDKDGFLDSHNVRLIGSTLRSRSTEMKGRILRGLENRIWPEIERGKIRPVICRVFPIREAEQAHALLERGENIGKVVLTVRDSE